MCSHFDHHHHPHRSPSHHMWLKSLVAFKLKKRFQGLLSLSEIVKLQLRLQEVTYNMYTKTNNPPSWISVDSIIGGEVITAQSVQCANAFLWFDDVQMHHGVGI